MNQDIYLATKKNSVSLEAQGSQALPRPASPFYLFYISSRHTTVSAYENRASRYILSKLS